VNVVFFHGLESPVVDGIPIGTKARFLRDRFGARTPTFDNRAAIAVVTRLAAGEPVSPAERAEAFAGPLATARTNLDGVDVAVGSSFGGALLVELLHERARAGLPNPAAVLLAGAGPKLFGHTALPPGRFALVHGLDDAVVPAVGSVALARSPGAALLLVDDGHSLRTTVGPTLERAIRWAAGQEPRGGLVAGVTVRPAIDADADAVRAVHLAAFPSQEEAKLVDAVWGTPDLVRSLVAERAGRVVGHAAWLRVTIDGHADAGLATRAGQPDGSHRGVGLAPLAVHPDAAGQRIGSALAMAGLDACRALGEPFAVVLGDPDYYATFGWLPSEDLGVRSTYDVPPGVFRAMELVPGGLEGVRGTARYPAVLDALGV